MDYNKKTARIAGVLYLFLAITGVYGLIYVSSQTYVHEDMAATAQKMLAKEFLFRTGIAGNLISQTLFVFLALAFYRLFKSVNEQHAKIMVALVLVSIPITFICESFNITALMVLKGDIMPSLPIEQKQEWAMAFLKMNGSGILVAEIFWGLWLIPLGLLFYKSGFMPRIVGILLVIGGIAYLIEVSAQLVFRDYRFFVNQFSSVILPISEFSTILWLLIKGVKDVKIE
jgi:Domain of unknown function (DUF4386)